jgi:hypothetical protein
MSTSSPSRDSHHVHAPCGHNRTYSFRFDAFHCAICNVWLEPKCANPACVFCEERPEKPPKTKE